MLRNDDDVKPIFEMALEFWQSKLLRSDDIDDISEVFREVFKESIPSSGSPYFKDTYSSQVVSLDKLVAREPADPERVKRAHALMEAAKSGAGEKRKPISVIDMGNGKFKVLDGNTTLQALRELGETEAVVEVKKSLKQQVRDQRSLDAVYEQAEKALPAFQEWVKRYAKDTNAVEIRMRPGLKSRDRAAQKAANDYAGVAARLTDIIGATLLYDSVEHVAAALHRIGKDPSVYKIKNRYENPTPEGYRDVLLVVRVDGHLCELQLNTRSMVEAKETGLGHKIYEAIRLVKPLADGRYGDENEMDMIAKGYILELRDLSVRVYRDAALMSASSSSANSMASDSETGLEFNRILAKLSGSLISTQVSGLRESIRKMLPVDFSMANGASSFSTNSNKRFIEVPPFDVSDITRNGKKVNAVVETGKKDQVYLNNEKTLVVQWAIAEAENLAASHNADFQPNPEFPQELQPRDRSRDAMRQQIFSISGKLNPELLGRSLYASAGAPIVGRDLVVESGNGRTMALKMRYAADNAEAYREWLTKNAADFGISPDAVRAMHAPVLVRIRLSDEDRREVTERANERDIASMSPAEQAKVDSGRLMADDLDLLHIGDDGEINNTANSGFITRFLQNLGSAESAGLLTSDGKPTRQLLDRIQAALFDKAYADDRLLAMMAEDSDPDAKNMLKALTMAAPIFAKAKALSGDESFEAVGRILDAIDVLRKAKRTGENIETLLNQYDLFGEIIPEETAAVVRFLSKNLRSAKRIGEFFQSVAKRYLYWAENKDQPDLFGELPSKPTVGDVTPEMVLESSDKTSILKDVAVRVASWVFRWLGVPFGNVFVDCAAIRQKHPEYFASDADVYRHVQYVMDHPTEYLEATNPDYVMVVRSDGKDKVAVVDMRLKGGKYRVRSAYVLSDGQLETKKRKIGERGGRISTGPANPTLESIQPLTQGPGAPFDALPLAFESESDENLNGKDTKVNRILESRQTDAARHKTMKDAVVSAKTFDDLAQIIRQSCGSNRISIEKYIDGFVAYHKRNPSMMEIDKDYKLQWLHEFGTRSSQTGRKLRYEFHLSDGRIVSADGALRAVNPTAYRRIKERYANLKQDKARLEIFNALPDNIRNDMIDALPLETIALSESNPEMAMNRWLESNDHFLKHIWTMNPGIYGEIIHRINQIGSAMQHAKTTPEQALTDYEGRNKMRDKVTIYEKNGAYYAVAGVSKALELSGWQRISEMEQIMESAMDWRSAIQNAMSVSDIETVFRNVFRDAFDIQYVDTGEKIGGARKDLWADIIAGKRRMDLASYEGMDSATAAKAVTRQNVVRGIAEAFQEAGVEPGALFMITKLFGSFDAKPGDSDEARMRYVAAADRVREYLGSVKTVSDFNAVLEQIRAEIAGLVMTPEQKAMDDEYKSRVQQWKDLSNRKWFEIIGRPGMISRSGVLNRQKAQKLYDEWCDSAKSAILPPDFVAQYNQMIRSLRNNAENDPDSPRNRYKALGKEFVDAVMLKSKTFYQHLQNAMKGNVTDYSFLEKISNKTPRRSVDENPQKPKWERTIPDTPTRSGTVERQFSPQDLIDLFGIRGVEYGNWMDRESSEHHTQMLGYGLMDLASVLGVPLKHVSHGGKLAIAFGARGGGFAAAHYEPGRKVINLTKLRGGGTLAHEWGHFLDNIIQMVASGGVQKLSFASGAKLYGDGIPEAVKQALLDVRSAIMQGNVGGTPSDPERNIYRSISYVDERLRQGWKPQDILDAAQQYYTKIGGSSKRKEKIIREIADYLHAKTGEQVFYGPKHSQFFENSKSMTSSSSPDSYWTRPHELFARAFEAYISDKMESSGLTNTYLVAGVRETDLGDNAPYPKGEERKRINAAFDKLIAALKENQILERAMTMLADDMILEDHIV